MKPFAAGDETRRYTRHWTPVHLDFVIPDIEVAVDRATKADAKCEGEIQTHKWGVSRRWAILSATGICFIQFLGRGPWL
jgi:hypothetical protein